MSKPASGNLKKATEQILACFQRGNALELEAAAQHALRRHPGHGFFHKALGVALIMQDKKTAAITALRRAAALLPADPEVFANLGIMLHRCGDLEAARSAFLQALKLAPNNPTTLTNHGNLLSDLLESKAALAAHDQALALRPDLVEARFNRAYASRQPWRLATAIDDCRDIVARHPGHLPAWDLLLCNLNYAPDVSPEEMRTAALGYGTAVRAAHPGGASFPLSRVEDFDPQRKLSIGFVSGDLRRHAVGHAVLSFIPHIDRSAFRFVAYSSQPVEDEVSQRLRDHFDAWHQVSTLQDSALAAKIAEDRIDILVDLAGHTAYNRLPAFVYRPAPVQVSWLGYYATTGLEEIDYFIGDQTVAPPHEAGHFVEQVYRLPGPYYCGMLDQARTPTPLPALENGFVTFVSCNNLLKLTDGVLATWAAILRALPSAQLLIKTRELADKSTSKVLADKLAGLGIASERLHLECDTPRDEYLSRLAACDIALDAFPFPGGATTLDCLSLGIPVLTMRGNRFIGHQGETLLTELGLDEWIASDDDDYVRRAIALATNTPSLAALRAALFEGIPAAPAFDGKRLAREISAAWRNMWQTRCGKR